MRPGTHGRRSRWPARTPDRPARAASRRALSALVALGSLGLGACGSSTSAAPSSNPGSAQTTTTNVQAVSPTTGATFSPAAIYRREAPGVVTVISVFHGGGGLLAGGGVRALGSGFVVSANGEIVTNAHVVTNGTGPGIHEAAQVYVNFSDGNEVPAHIVGFDPNSDVALLHVNPAGLSLRALPLGSSSHLVVGSPVAAIGSPFGEAQSLSVGVISATGRSIDSLTGFQIPGAIQTDAAINHGNSGGPLVDAGGRVLGINSQIASSSGGGEGVGFSVPVDTVKRSLNQLRRGGHVRYAYLGISTVAVFPQLARHFALPTTYGAFVQVVVHGGPAGKAGLHGGSHTSVFDAQPYRVGGDVISAVNGQAVRHSADLGRAISQLSPGQQVTLQVWTGHQRHNVTLKLAERPANTSPSSLP